MQWYIRNISFSTFSSAQRLLTFLPWDTLPASNLIISTLLIEPSKLPFFFFFFNINSTFFWDAHREKSSFVLLEIENIYSDPRESTPGWEAVGGPGHLPGWERRGWDGEHGPGEDERDAESKLERTGPPSPPAAFQFISETTGNRGNSVAKGESQTLRSKSWCCRGMALGLGRRWAHKVAQL